MTFLSSLSRSIQNPTLAPFMAAAMFLFSACEEKHIGRLCDIGSTMALDPKTIAVNPQALECPSRLCILPAQDKSTTMAGTAAFCTAECGGDDDCADAETGPEGDMVDKRCEQGFVCRRIVPKLENNPLSCRPVCVCKDFLLTGDIDMPGPPPVSCL